jgi:hypothetical protein
MFGALCIGFICGMLLMHALHEIEHYQNGDYDESN